MEDKVCSDEERNEYKLAYQLFDYNNTGGITKEKLGKVMRDLGQNPSDQEIEDMINEVDADENGMIEFEEFVLLMSRNKEMHDTEEEFQELFKIFDQQNANQITKEDLKTVLDNIGERLEDHDIDEIMKEADLDDKGFIIYEEFVRMMKGNT